jgi:hypothetical protein
MSALGDRSADTSQAARIDAAGNSANAASKNMFLLPNNAAQQGTTTHAIVLRPTSFSQAPAGRHQRNRAAVQRAMASAPSPWLSSARSNSQSPDEVGSHATRHTSLVTRHTPHATRHTPHATRHTPHVTRHTPHVTRHTPREQPAAPRREGTQSSGFPATQAEQTGCQT